MSLDVLSHIRVLDLSRLLPGPYCTMLLADFGAEVIKIEPPKGDPVRMFPPFLDNHESAYYVAFNRNKKSLSLNLRKDEGKKLLLRLCQKADVLVESFRPGVTKQMGIDFETVHHYNERLIYCSISGYGQESPMNNEPGHDINFLSISGILDLCGPKNQPVLPGIQVGDIGGGSLPAFAAILLALMAREKTGQGQYVDCSMTDNLFFYLPVIMAEYWVSNEPPTRGEFILSGSYANYSIYKTKDQKFISVGALEENFWRRFVEKLGYPEWGDDYLEVIFNQDYRKKVAEIILTRSQDEWLRIFKGSNCCVTPVYSIVEAEKYMASRMIAQNKGYNVISNPFKLTMTPPIMARNPAPSLGHDTESVLSSLLNYSKKEIKRLGREGIVYSPD
ncbi:MAG: CaiB/BaiF CoA transferase family protein [Candidatus Hodarchaeota archaeon]